MKTLSIAIAATGLVALTANVAFADADYSDRMAFYSELNHETVGAAYQSAPSAAIEGRQAAYVTGHHHVRAIAPAEPTSNPFYANLMDARTSGKANMEP